MIVTNKGGPILFGKIELVHGRNALTEAQAEELSAGLEAHPGWAHAAEEYFRSGRLGAGDPPPPPAPPNPKDLASARAEAEDKVRAETLARLPSMSAAELDAAFSATEDSALAEALLAQMKVLSARPVPEAKAQVLNVPPPAPAPARP